MGPVRPPARRILCCASRPAAPARPRPPPRPATRPWVPASGFHDEALSAKIRPRPGGLDAAQRRPFEAEGQLPADRPLDALAVALPDRRRAEPLGRAVDLDPGRTQALGRQAQ